MKTLAGLNTVKNVPPMTELEKFNWKLPRPFRMLVLLAIYLGLAASAAAQAWNQLPNMVQSRYRHAAAGGHLSNGEGRVFVFGGIVFNYNYTTVDAYDPLRNRWDNPGTYPDMPISRMRPAIATDSNGMIYVIGGTGPALTALASIDVFDPAIPPHGAWSTIPDMPTARHSAGAAFGPNGTLYVVGGENASGSQRFDVVESFDGTSWTTLAPLPMPLPGVGGAPVGAAIGCDGQLIVVSNSWPGGGSCTSHTYELDINNPSSGWTAKAPMPGCLGGRGLIRAANDLIYAVNDGDYYAPSPGDTTVYSYNSRANSWTLESDTAAGHIELGVAALGNRIYASGGTSKFGANHALRFESLATGTISTCRAWQSLHTKAKDIGVGADGIAWKIGDSTRSGGYDIARWNGSWTPIGGGAVRIDGGPNDEAWVVNSYGQIYKYKTGPGWQHIPGSATDIGVGANGDVWKIGTNYSHPHGYDISKWSGSSWIGIGGRAVRIDVDSVGNPWVVNGNGGIYKYTQSSQSWQGFPGRATDIGVGADDSVWKTDGPPAPSSVYGFEISKWNAPLWEALPTGEAEEISVGPDGEPWVVNLLDNLYRRF